jgi:hypothetical protein
MMEHPFFRGLDWDKVRNKEIRPSAFQRDEVIVGENVKDVDSGPLPGEEPDPNGLKGFTYGNSTTDNME